MVLDIILGVIILISIIVGYKKGFITMLASFIGKFVALVISYFYYGAVKDILIKFTGIDEFIFEKVKLSLKSLGGHVAETSVAGSDISAISKMDMPLNLKTKIVDYLTDTGSSIGKSAVHSISNFLMTIVSFFILFFAILLLITIIAKIFNIIAKLPVLKTFNALGGIIFSLLTTYLILTIIFLLMTTFLTMGFSDMLKQFIDNSVIATALIKYNPILIMLSNAYF